MIALIGNIQIAKDIQSHAGGIIQACVGSRTAIASEGCTAITRHGSDDAIGVHHADALAAWVRDIHGAKGIHGHAIGIIQAGIGGRTTVPGEGCAAIARHGNNPIGQICTIELPLIGKRSRASRNGAKVDCASQRDRLTDWLS